MVSGPITSWQIDGENVKTVWFHFLGLQNQCGWRLQPGNLKRFAPWKKNYDQLSILKSRDITLPTKLCLVKVMVFPVAMYGCESWTIKKAEILLHWCIGEDSREEFQPFNPKGNQSWIFTGRTDADAEVPILWPLDAKNWLIRKDPDVGKRLKAGGEGDNKDEMVGWHHWLSGHEFEQVPGDGDGQGSLACCSPWGCKKSDMTERMNWTKHFLVALPQLTNSRSPNHPFFCLVTSPQFVALC